MGGFCRIIYIMMTKHTAHDFCMHIYRMIYGQRLMFIISQYYTFKHTIINLSSTTLVRLCRVLAIINVSQLAVLYDSSYDSNTYDVH